MQQLFINIRKIFDIHRFAQLKFGSFDIIYKQLYAPGVYTLNFPLMAKNIPHIGNTLLHILQKIRAIRTLSPFKAAEYAVIAGFSIHYSLHKYEYK